MNNEDLSNMNEDLSSMPWFTGSLDSDIPSYKQFFDRKKEARTITEQKELREEAQSTDFLISLIESVRNQIPEVKSYDQELFHLAEEIEEVKKNGFPDFNWISKAVTQVDSEYEELRDNLAEMKGRLDMEVNRLTESMTVSDFELKTDTKAIYEKVFDTNIKLNTEARDRVEQIGLIKEEIHTTKNKIIEYLEETSLKILDLNNNYQKGDKVLREKVEKEYDLLKEKTGKEYQSLKESIEEKADANDTKISEAIVYFNDIKTKVDNLDIRYYDKDIKSVQESVTQVQRLVKSLEEKLNSKVYELKADLEEGLLNIPPNVDNSDPLTPLDKLETTIEGLSRNYRLFVNRVQEQLSTFGGGGAVWLWDLNDVDIGTPTSNRYPVIADNAPLVFDSAKEQWVPGTPGGSGVGTFLPLSGGTMTGDINFNAGQQFAGTLELAGGTMTGEIGFTTQQTFPGALATTGGTMVGDITFNSGQTFPGAFISTDGGTISGNTTYIGSTTGNDNLQTKTSVQSLIASQVSGGFSFIGTTNVATDSPGAGVTGGDFYINTAVGVANTNWTGIAGLTIAADQLIIYSNNDTRWFAGAVEDNSTYLQKAGGTMTGPLTLEAAATFTKERAGNGNNDFVIEGTTVTSIGDTQAQLFFVNRNGVNANPDAINYDGLVDNDENLQNKKSVSALITSANQNLLPKSGGTMTGTLTVDEVTVPKAKTITIKRGNNNTSIGGLDIKGYAYNDFQTITDIFAVSYGNGSSTGDSINYKGKTDGANNLQTKTSVDSAISAAITADGNLLRGGSIISTGGTAANTGSLRIQQSALADSGQLNIFNSSSEPQVNINPGFGITFGNGVFDSNAKTIFFNTSAASGGFFQVNNSGKFHWKDLTSDFMTLNASSLTVNSPANFGGSTFTVERGAGSSSNTTNFTIRGMLPGSIGTTDSALLSIKRSSGQGDTIQYFGSTTNQTSAIQTKASVETLITSNAITPGTSQFQNQADNTGTTLTGFFLADYSKNSDDIVTLLCDIQDGNNIVAGDVLCVLPAGFRPASADNTGGFTPVFTCVNSDSNPTITSQWMVKKDGSITCMSVSGGSQKFYGQVIFSVHDPN